MKTPCDFTLAEFNSTLAHSFPLIRPFQIGGEWVFDLPLYNVDSPYAIRIYSSVDTSTNRSRSKGKDAIRVVTVTDKGFRSFCRVYRTAGWETRLIEQIKKAVKKMELPPIVFGVDWAALDAKDHSAIVKVSINDQEQKIVETIRNSESAFFVHDDLIGSHPDSCYRDCVVCGHEATTKTEEGDPVCSWHTFVDESFRTWMAA